VSAQGLTGQISGTITDTGGGVIPGVTVTLTNAGTRATRESITGADGGFVFPDLLAGTYNLSAALSGFRTTTKGIVLSSTERVALRAIHLEVGGLTETISVQAEALKVQTTTGERSALITQQQIEDTGIKGRDFMGVLKTLPGVVDTNGRDAPGWGTVSAGITINGRNSFNFSYDGVTNKDTGSNSGNYSAPGLDSIGEIRVQTSNFQAEYGRSSGATITVVTKSGTRDFRGTAAFYRRNESLNANEWARNRQGLPKPIYRYDNTAYTIGGPVLLPGTSYNRGRDKLFFFWSQDLLPRTDPGALNTRNMPTALERRGDFSQTFDSQGRLVNIRDPLASGPRVTLAPGCFPGNIIPATESTLSGSRCPTDAAAERERSDRHAPVQLHLPDRARSAAQRPGAADGLECRARHHLLFARAVRLRSVQGRRLRAARQHRRLAAVPGQVRDPDLRHRQYAAAHVEPAHVLGIHVRHEPFAPAGGRADAGRPHAQPAGHRAEQPVKPSRPTPETPSEREPRARTPGPSLDRGT
jgi:hypothetical protein